MIQKQSNKTINALQIKRSEKIGPISRNADIYGSQRRLKLLNAFIVKKSLEKKKDTTPASIVKDAFVISATLKKHLE